MAPLLAYDRPREALDKLLLLTFATKLVQFHSRLGELLLKDVDPGFVLLVRLCCFFS